MGNIEHWLVASSESIRVMAHEDDYNEGDTLINVALNEGGHVSVVVIQTTPTQGVVEALRATVEAIGRVQDGDLHPGRNLASTYVEAKAILDRLGEQ